MSKGEAAVTIAGLVLAAGRSARLGRPKQLLDVGGATLLDCTLSMVRRCGLDQIVVALGGGSAEIRETVDLDGCDVVENEEFMTGCSSTIVVALDAIVPGVEGVVLFLGDQPLVRPADVRTLVDVTSARPDADIGVCAYDDGQGHPLWFKRSMFAELRTLRGDKAIWKLLASAQFSTVEVRMAGPTPLDVDTWEDYEELLAQMSTARIAGAGVEEVRER